MLCESTPCRVLLVALAISGRLQRSRQKTVINFSIYSFVYSSHRSLRRLTSSLQHASAVQHKNSETLHSSSARKHYCFSALVKQTLHRYYRLHDTGAAFRFEKHDTHMCLSCLSAGSERNSTNSPPCSTACLTVLERDLIQAPLMLPCTHYTWPKTF